MSVYCIRCTEATEPMTKEEVDAIDIIIDKADTPSTEDVH